jgi:hypothetical protein
LLKMMLFVWVVGREMVGLSIESIDEALKLVTQGVESHVA